MTVSGNVALGSGSSATASAVTINNGGTLQGGGTITANVTNSGTIYPSGVGGLGGTLTINGTYTQTSGGTLEIDVSGTSAGQFDVLSASGTATLGGSLVVNFVNGYTPNSTVQTLNVVTDTSQSGAFALTTPTTGSFTLGQWYQSNAVQLITAVYYKPANSGGDWDTAANWSNGAVPAQNVVIPTGVIVTHTGTTFSETIKNLDVEGTLNFGNGTLSLSNGTLTDSGTVTLGNQINSSSSGEMIFNSTQTISGNGVITFGFFNNSIFSGNANQTLTIASGITIQGQTGQIFGNAAVVNNGTINANASGQKITIAPGTTTFTNNGTVEGTNGGSISIAFATGTNTGTVQATGGGNITVTGNSAIGIYTGFGNLSISGGGTLFINSGNTNSWQNTATISVTGSTLDLGGTVTQANLGTVVSNPGSQPSAPAIILNSGSTQTIASSSGATESGNTVTITTTAAHGFHVGQQVTISSVGVAGYNGTFAIASVGSTTFTYINPTSGLAASGGGSASVSGANFVGTITGGLTLSSTTGSWSLGDANNGNAGTGTLSGGSFSTSGGASLYATFNSALSGVTLNSPIDLSTFNNQVTVTNGLTLNNVTLNLGNASNSSTAGELVFSNTENLSGTGTINFGFYVQNEIFTGSSATLTIGSNITIQGESGQFNGNSPIINNGLINSGTSGDTITIQSALPSFTNNNIVEGTNGGSINVAFGATGSNTGTVQVTGGGNLTITGGNTSTTFSGFGNVSISGGGTLYINSGNVNPWQNAGTITVTGSTIDLGGTFTQAGLGTIASNPGSPPSAPALLLNSGNRVDRHRHRIE